MTKSMVNPDEAFASHKRSKLRRKKRVRSMEFRYSDDQARGPDGKFEGGGLETASAHFKDATKTLDAKGTKAEIKGTTNIGDKAPSPGTQTGVHAMTFYESALGSHVINDSLRGQQLMSGSGHDQLVATAKAYTDTMDKSFRDAPKTGETYMAYRGMAIPEGTEFKPGMILEDKGFTSLTSDKDMAGKFAEGRATGQINLGDGNVTEVHSEGGRAVVAAVEIPKGSSVLAGERNIGEVVLPRGSMFEVTGVTKSGEPLLRARTMTS